MNDTICTIPITEVFEKTDGCPICNMRDTIENRIIEYILGPAMMEPDVRITSNKSGYCGTHLKMMQSRQSRLSLALILESHLDELSKNIKPNKPNKKALYKSVRIIETCFVCDKVEWGLSRLLKTLYRKYSEDMDFRNLFKKQEYICHPHVEMLLSQSTEVSKRYKEEWEKDITTLFQGYLETLKTEIHKFTTMFDYRNQGENADWGNSRDSIERTARFLTGRN